jgi:hypothetical protein
MSRKKKAPGPVQTNQVRNRTDDDNVDAGAAVSKPAEGVFEDILRRESQNRRSLEYYRAHRDEILRKRADRSQAKRATLRKARVIAALLELPEPDRAEILRLFNHERRVD